MPVFISCYSKPWMDYEKMILWAQTNTRPPYVFYTLRPLICSYFVCICAHYMSYFGHISTLSGHSVFIFGHLDLWDNFESFN